MPAPVILFVYALAVARVTRLIAADRITEAPRRWLAERLWAPKIPADEANRRLPALVEHSGLAAAQRYLAWERLENGAEPPLSVYLLSCPWCASIYVAAVAAPLAWFWGSSPWLLVPAIALAFSYVTGWLSMSER
jgi:hypothetical protein